jgi:hypothetical protein
MQNATLAANEMNDFIPTPAGFKTMSSRKTDSTIKQTNRHPSNNHCRGVRKALWTHEGRKGPGRKENNLTQGIGINTTKSQGHRSTSACLCTRRSTSQNHATGATVGMRNTSGYGGIKTRTRGCTETTEGDGVRKKQILGSGQTGSSLQERMAM